MSKTYSIRNLNEKNVASLIKKLKAYENTLIKKTQTFANKLADVGIQIAYQNEGLYAGHLVFTKVVKDVSGANYTLAFVGRKKHDIKVAWQTKDGIKTADVDPLLMAEFGSGWLANNMWEIGGVGQGTFPNQKHANDPKGWYWEDLKGVTHHSIGQLPSYPMYKAWLAMQQDIRTICNEVFR